MKESSGYRPFHLMSENLFVNHSQTCLEWVRMIIAIRYLQSWNLGARQSHRVSSLLLVHPTSPLLPYTHINCTLFYYICTRPPRCAPRPLESQSREVRWMWQILLVDWNWATSKILHREGAEASRARCITWDNQTDAHWLTLTLNPRSTRHPADVARALRSLLRPSTPAHL